MITTQLLKIDKVKMNPDNPRVFTKANIESIVISLLTFPEMYSDARSSVIRNGIVLGGNLRLKGLRTIADYELTTISQLIAEHSKDKSEERIKFLIDFWSEFKRTKSITFINADNFTDQQAKEFLIRDNVSTGGWDMDLLANNYDSNELNDWGVSVWIPEDEEEEIEESEKESDYTQKIDAPVYEPKNDKPDIAVLYDSEKYKQLIIDIENSNVPNDVKIFLKVAASRHIVFNYENIADYYANSDKDTQILMEDSALVIIDFNKAIEKGYVKLTKEIESQYIGEYHNE